MGQHRRARKLGAPVEGHDVGLKFRAEGAVSIRGPEALHRGEGATQPRHCWVDRRGSTHQPKSGHAPLMRDQDRNGRKAGLCSQYGGGSGPEAVRGPALNLSPENLHFSEHALGRDKEVGAV